MRFRPRPLHLTGQDRQSCAWSLRAFGLPLSGRQYANDSLQRDGVTVEIENQNKPALTANWIANRPKAG
ncbi:hypothetical protein EMEDMD4_1250008 [Sinorhizobium medicae]|uniref:Uncharacterized protein n=1 Tax=Sinorhizobium medicae TaxID=110321 RepID=A0A508WQM8_9HYPH|nr:hypothetical protein EMEDMD4_1250008 [Sinorhizobium medicae]